MIHPEQLQILVDNHIRVALDQAPRNLMDALRRHLRQHDSREDQPTERNTVDELLNLLQNQGGQYVLPQGLLPKVTETCRRHGVSYQVLDRRAMVSCPAFRAQHQLSTAGQEAVRRLLLRDSGILVAADEDSRQSIATELVARRQQRTLIAVAKKQEVSSWSSRLQQAMGLGSPLIQPLSEAKPETRLVIGTYEAVLRQPVSFLTQEFGMVVYDHLNQIDALSLIKTIRAAGARYLLGLAQDTQRPDGLQGPLFLALGGIIHQLPAAARHSTLRLGCRYQATPFCFPYAGRQHYQAMLAALAADEERGQLIVQDIVTEAKAGHICLVLSERRDHLELLARFLPADDPHLSCATLSSSVRLPERRQLLARYEKGEINVLLATGQIAGEAIMTPRASRLFLSFPFSYARKLEPLVNSLLQPVAQQEDAVLYDYDDYRVVPLHKAFEKRRCFLDRFTRQAEQQALAHSQLKLPFLP